MRPCLILFFTFTCFACSQSKEQQNQKESTEIALSEQIDGPANVRNAINGELIFTLYDNAPVECTPPKNDWRVISVNFTNPETDYEGPFLKKGSKIMLDGEVIGEVIQNTEATNFGLIGYTHKDNIRPESLIEDKFASYLQKAEFNRNKKVFEEFIKNYQLEKQEYFEPYSVFANLENSVVDPSPLFRLGLVFQQEQLIAILHSRPLNIKGTSNHQLNRAFDCLVYDDVPNADEIVALFNHFVNSVD